MKQLLIFLSVFALATISCCKKTSLGKGTPKCIEAKIKDFDKSSNCNTANVKEYNFQNKIVYAFDPGICGADMTTEVLSSDCSTLGYLGGFAGNTKINGEDFSNATLAKTLWEKK